MWDQFLTGIMVDDNWVALLSRLTIEVVVLSLPHILLRI